MASSDPQHIASSSIELGASNTSIGNSNQKIDDIVEQLRVVLHGESCSTYTWLTDVIPDQTPEDANNLVEESVTEFSGKKVIITGYHPTGYRCTTHGGACDIRRGDSDCVFTVSGHTHVYHTCPYTGSHCRCRFMRGRRPIRRRRPTRKCDDISSEYIRRILQYLQYCERYILHIQGRGTCYYRNTDSGVENLREWSKICDNGSQGPLEGLLFPGNVCDEHEEVESSGSSQQQPKKNKNWRDSETDQSDLTISTPVKKSRRKRSIPYMGNSYSGNEAQQVEASLENLVSAEYKRNIQISELLCQKMLELCTVPLSNCVNTNEWKSHRYLRTFNLTSPQFKQASKYANRRFIDAKIEDLIDFYIMQENWPLFNAISKPSDIYYSYEKSIKILDFVFEKQFGNVARVLKKFYDIFNKITMKKNTILLYGAPGSGKNFIMDAFINFFISVGTINTLNKTNLFALQDLVDRRVGLANDISISSSELEYMKVVCGGNQATVRVKFESDGTVNRTPLVFLSNNKSFFPLHEEAWQQRIYALGTTHVPELANLKKLVYPLAVVGLWEKYNILESNTTFVYNNEF